ncbi:hypothetical protein BN135_1148 [Cronobacter muytjensii 530]
MLLFLAMRSQNNYNLAHIVAARKRKTCTQAAAWRFSLPALSGTLHAVTF